MSIINGHYSILSSTVAPVSFMAQLLLVVSVRYFDDSAVRFPTRRGSTTIAVGASSRQRSSSSDTSHHEETWTADMLVSGILSCSACALCFLLDTLPTCDPDMLAILVAEGWPRGLACVAMLSSVLSALICHVSAAIRFRREGFVWQPFRGDFRFVRLQACGWTLFAVVVMVQLVLAFSSSRLLVSSVQTGIFSVVGITAVVAQWLLVSSVRLYADSAAAAHKARNLDGGSPTAGTRRTVSSSRIDEGGIRVSLPPGKDGCKENTNRVTTVALIICCLTDNRKRTAPDIKYIFDRANGNLGAQGSVAFMFDQRSVFVVETGGRDEDALTELALEIGVDDVGTKSA